METKGIEPSFPRCDRGVLPLHYVPETTNTILLKTLSRFNLFFAAFSESSELPCIVANYFFYRLSHRLRFTIGRIADSHQLDDSNIFGYC